MTDEDTNYCCVSDIAAKLVEVQELQAKFWDALGELEALTGLTLDSTVNYSDCDVESLLEAGEPMG